LNKTLAFAAKNSSLVKNELAIRQGNFKLITNDSFSNPSLYNLKIDLGEKNDIVKQNPEVVQKLLKLLKAWHSDVNKGIKKRS
jgi:hypothetical protein